MIDVNTGSGFWNTVNGPIAGVVATAMVAWLVWSARKFVQETSSEPKPGSTHDIQRKSITKGELQQEIQVTLRSLMSEFEIKLRDSLIDPIRADVAELHGCVDNVRSDMETLRASVRHDTRNSLMSIVQSMTNMETSVSQTLTRLEERVRRGEIESAQTLVRMKELEDKQRILFAQHRPPK